MTGMVDAMRGRVAQGVLYASGLGLMAAAIGANLRTTLSGIAHPVDAALQVAAVAGVELALIGASHQLIASIRRRQWGIALASAACAGLAGYAAIVGSSAYTYEKFRTSDENRRVAAAAALRAEQAAILEGPQGEVVRVLREELMSYADVRQTATIRADLAECGKCPRRKRLEQQLDKAERRDATAENLVTAEKALPKAQPRSTVDPSAELFTRLAGLDAERTALGNVLAWLLVLQLGPALCFMLAAANAPPAAPRPDRGAELAPVAAPTVGAPTEPKIVSSPQNTEPAAGRAHFGRQPKDVAKLVAHVDAAGGRVETTTRELAAATKIHRRSLRHAMDAADMGQLLKVTVTRKGVVLEAIGGGTLH